MPNPTTEGEAIATRLLTDIATAALVGTRIYPSKPTQEPNGDYIVYFRTAGGGGKRLKARNGLQNYSVRVEAVAETQAKAEAILKAVTNRLTPAEGTWKDSTIGVQGCYSQGDADEQTLEDGRQVSGATFGIWFKAQT
jgi:hypothetical protein